MRLEKLILQTVIHRSEWQNDFGVMYTHDGEDCCLLTCLHPKDRGGQIKIYINSLTASQLIRLFNIQTLRQFNSLTPRRLQAIFDQQGPARLFVAVDDSYDILEFRWQNGQLNCYDIEKHVGKVSYGANRIQELVDFTERYFVSGC